MLPRIKLQKIRDLFWKNRANILLKIFTTDKTVILIEEGRPFIRNPKRIMKLN